MDASVIAAKDLRVALVGLPNCGKTALFNRLTGSRQKVANYPGVTVERKEGHFVGPSRRRYLVLDLPGTYSLSPTTLDEAITRDVALGRLAGEQRPEVVVLVADATHLALSLRLVLEVKRLGLPLVVALNMSDLARRRGYALDRERLSRELGAPVVETVAVAAGGADELVRELERSGALAPAVASAAAAPAADWRDPTPEEVRASHVEAARILKAIGYRVPLRSRAAVQFDQVLMHPVGGMLILAALLFFVFQAVFAWAEAPMEWIDAGVASLANALNAALPEGVLKSLLVDGIVAGVGSVLVFLPQIIILFFFILALEDSGYLPRAAYLLDRVMGSVGLSGRAFIPLLSSFACAIPGIMATRTIPNVRDRIATIMIAPLMTCSARLPVYALLIAAFIPDRAVGWMNLQGLVMFALYFAGIVSALAVAWVMKWRSKGARYHPLMLELPDYQWPNLRNLAFGLWERVQIFMVRVGGIILAMMVLLWFLSSYPAPPPGATGAPIEYSFAGMLGRALQVVFAPIGFNWQISIALVPGLAAREVAVGALGTVYAMSGNDPDLATTLTPVIAQGWPLATALALLAWYVFAPQCLSTLAVVKRETGGWRHPLIMAGYLFGLAYLAAFVTYRVALAFGGG
ncbi:MAG: ferrous iron transporter B [Steroidobacteraceae bacterium]|jgi:ferrous iron transport protein B|nr:ferrous iron transporter B [Steroidobacteraceae bacterium]